MEEIQRFNDIYSELYSKLKWKLDKKQLMLIAAMYVTNSKEFHFKRFLEIADYIKDNVGVFSLLKSSQRYSIAATLDTVSDDPKKSFHDFTGIYEGLISNGFHRNLFTYIAAGVLLKSEPEQLDRVLKNTLAIYKSMKKHHYFLTDMGDYPLAAVLAQIGKEPEDTVQHIEEYYQALHKKGFPRGNDLQFLSHILALESNHQPDVKAEQCLTIRDLLLKAKIKVKRDYYPYLGMLTFLDHFEVESLRSLTESLNGEKQFKWEKDINFMLSVLFLMNQYNTFGDAARTGLNVSIETLIQAQQAAMTACMTAAAAASSSSAGNS